MALNYIAVKQSPGVIANQSITAIPVLGVILALLLCGCATDQLPNAKSNHSFILAAKIGDAIGVQTQIDKGADVNTQDQNGITPLVTAAFYGNMEIAGLLLKNGADVNAHGLSNYPPLGAAILQDREDMVKLLISSGADVNIKFNDGRTPLHLAVFEECEDIVKLLIADGAQVNVKDGNGVTPLHDAVNSRNKKIVELLVLRGAAIRAKDNDGIDPLMASIHTTLYPILIAGRVTKTKKRHLSLLKIKTKKTVKKKSIQDGRLTVLPVPA